MIFKNQYNVPLVVRSENDIQKIDVCMALIFGMQENTVFREETFDKYHSSILSLLQIYCAELLLSMEKNKHSEAFEMLQIAARMIKDESDGRSIIINAGLSHLLDGDYFSARYAFYGLLVQNPKDFFAFYVVHMIEFNNGMTSCMLETLHVVRDSWEKNDIFYGYCKGIEAFILNENGFYAASLECGKEALSLNPEDIYAIHAICHHYYDNRHYHQGRIFMEQMAAHWQNNYGMRLHLYWHYAMFLMKENGRHLLYDIYQSIRNKNHTHSLEDLDATSFLFRLSLYDDTDCFHEEARELVKNWYHFNELGFYFFNDFHASLIFSLSGRVDLIDYLILQSNHSRPVGFSKTKIILLNAIKHHTLNEHQEVVNLLSKPLDFHFMGGSKAQRSIISEILTHAKNKLEINCDY